jgi:putative membrane protein
MNRNRMYSLAVAATLCCAPAFAQLGSTNGAGAPGSSRGAQNAPSAGANGQYTGQGVGKAGVTSDATRPGPAHDQEFVTKALEGSMAEVELGKLALQKSNDEQVKQFAQEMVDDHTKMIDQMKPVAEKVGATMPSSPSKAQMKTMDKLKALSGDSFDQAYIKDMVKDHRQDNAEFKQEASSTQNSQLREVVQQGDQIIQKHLQHIEQIAKSKGSGGNKSSGTR